MIWLRKQAVFFTLVAFLHGCASQSTVPYATPPGGDRTIPRDIVVTAARFQPEAKLDLLLRSKAELARAGAGRGALEGAGGLMQGASGCSGDAFCAAAILLLLPVFMGVGAVVGAVRDAPAAAPAEAIERGQKAMQEGIARLDLQRGVQAAMAKELRDRGVAASVAEEWSVGPATPEESPRYETLASGKAILEVSVLGFQFKQAPRTDSKKVSYLLSMTTRVRLLASADRTILDEMNRVYESEARSATEWLSDNAQLFEASLGEAIGDVSRSVAHEMFLLYYPAIRAAPAPASSGKPLVPEYVLRPVYPLPVKSFDLRGPFIAKYRTSWAGLRFVPVDDLQPTLRWESFPRPVDVAGLGGQAGRFGDVRYEVVVYDNLAVDFESSQRVYRRTELAEPSHRIEQALQPCGQYFWTVRAHFRVDGWPRVTEWTGAYDALPSTKPWEYRRGLKVGPIASLLRVNPQHMFLPFRAPAADGKTCD